MYLIGEILRWLLQVYFYVLVGRFIIELYLSLSRGARPNGVVLVLFEIVMTLTDPPLKFIRRFVRPVRLGAVALDFSWTILIFAVALLTQLIQRFLG